MGRMLVEAVLADPAATLVAAFDQPGSPAVGQDAGAALGRLTGVAIGGDAEAALAAGVDVLIDFTRPEGTLAHLALAQRLGVAVVIGTTGFSPEGKAAIGAAAQHIGVVFSPNMSVGVNLLLKLVQTAAAALPESYDAEVWEVHHRHKVDAPSGTALALGEAVARGRGVALADKAVYAREGHTGERPAGAIGFATLRGGDIVGDHTVLFAGPGERIEITHRSASRATYAQGSLRAAHFVAGRGPGLFDMADVLGLDGPGAR